MLVFNCQVTQYQEWEHLCIILYRRIIYTNHVVWLVILSRTHAMSMHYILHEISLCYLQTTNLHECPSGGNHVQTWSAWHPTRYCQDHEEGQPNRGPWALIIVAFWETKRRCTQSCLLLWNCATNLVWPQTKLNLLERILYWSEQDC